MLTIATEFESRACASKTGWRLFDRIDVALTACYFPTGVGWFFYFKIPTILNGFKLTAACNKAQWLAKRKGFVGTFTNVTIHLGLVVRQEVNVILNVIFLFSNFLHNNHHMPPRSMPRP